MSSPVLALPFLCVVLLSGCTGDRFATCSGPVVVHPAGKCSARYYQTDYRSGGKVTQALVDCHALPAKPGGNVVALHSVANGIGLKWLTADILEVAVPVGVPLKDQRLANAYGEHTIQYVYRDLREGEAEFSGCGLGKSGGA